MKLPILLNLLRPCCIAGPLLLSLLAGAAHAQSVSGVWETIDDRTGKPRSLVRIEEHQGVLTGRIVKRLDPEASETDVCKRCTDERKDAPIVGLLIIRGSRRTPDNPLRWDQGYVLDPEDGKEYRVRITLHADGRRLEVRGYVGTPLIGRTQIWLRSS